MGGSHDDEIWISTGDLMAAVVAVTIMLFVLSALETAGEATSKINAEARRRAAEAQQRTAEAAAAAATQARRAHVDQVFNSIAAVISAQGLGDSLEVDATLRVIRLREATFAKASACVNVNARRALAAWSAHLREQMEHEPTIDLQVQGHTDERDVRRRAERTDAFSARRCALFDDNYTLSAARAREVRRIIVGDDQSDDGSSWPNALKDRVAVVGYGSSRPLARGASAEVNRRVEIHVQGLEQPPVIATTGGLPAER